MIVNSGQDNSWRKPAKRNNREVTGMKTIKTAIYFDEKSVRQFEKDCTQVGLSQSEGITFLIEKFLASNDYQVIEKHIPENYQVKYVRSDYNLIKRLDTIIGKGFRSSAIREAYRRYAVDLRSIKNKGKLIPVYFRTTGELAEKINRLANGRPTAMVIREAVDKLIRQKNTIKEIQRVGKKLRDPQQTLLYESQLIRLIKLQEHLKNRTGTTVTLNNILNLAVIRF